MLSLIFVLPVSRCAPTHSLTKVGGLGSIVSLTEQGFAGHSTRLRRHATARDCQLNSATQNLLQDAGFRLGDRPRPDRVRPCPKEPERRPADHVTLQIERVADRSVRREKTLRQILGFEALNLSLAPSERQM